MSFMDDLLKKKALEAGNPNAAVPMQDTGATKDSVESHPVVNSAPPTLSGSEILSGIEGSQWGNGYNTPAPELVVLEPDAELLEANECCFEAIKGMPFIAMPDGSKIKSHNGFFYMTLDKAQEADVFTYLQRGNLRQVKPEPKAE